MLTLCSAAPAPPSTITREWEEAANQRALEMKLDPITGELNPYFQVAGISDHGLLVIRYCVGGIQGQGLRSNQIDKTAGALSLHQQFAAALHLSTSTIQRFIVVTLPMKHSFYLYSFFLLIFSLSHWTHVSAATTTMVHNYAFQEYGYVFHDFTSILLGL